MTRAPLPGLRRLGYALGNAGYLLTDRLVAVVLVYFWVPPTDSDLPRWLPPGTWALGLTAFGAAMLLGRVVDAVADPIVGWASDRSTARAGRRLAFLRAGLVPMVALPVVAFFPPSEAPSMANAVFLGGVLTAYFVAFTVYAAPYLALVPELARDDDDRVSLSTWMALCALPAGAAGIAWTAGYDGLRAVGWDGVTSLRAVAMALAGIALVAGLGPIVALDEARDADPVPSQLSLREALALTLRDRAYMRFLLALVGVLFAANLVQPLLPYLARLTGRTEGFATVLGAVLLVATLGAFAALPRVVARTGPTRAFALAAAAMGAGAATTGAVDPGAGDGWNLTILTVAMLAVGTGTAGLLTLPHVIVAHLVDADAERTGSKRGAVYLGLQGLATKWVFGLALAVLAGLFDTWGNSVAEPSGVLFAGPLAGIACGLAALLLWHQPTARPA